MRVVCDKRDQDLLFLSQGMLPGLKRFLTGWHLRRCSECKEKVAGFTEASRQLRLAFGGSPVPLVAGPRYSRLGLALALAVLLAALGVATYSIIPKEEIMPPAVAGDSCVPANSKWGKIQHQRKEEAAKKERGKTKAKLSGSRMELPAAKK